MWFFDMIQVNLRFRKDRRKSSFFKDFYYCTIFTVFMYHNLHVVYCVCILYLLYIWFQKKFPPCGPDIGSCTIQVQFVKGGRSDVWIVEYPLNTVGTSYSTSRKPNMIINTCTAGSSTGTYCTYSTQEKAYSNWVIHNLNNEAYDTSQYNYPMKSP